LNLGLRAARTRSANRYANDTAAPARLHFRGLQSTLKRDEIW